MDIFERGSSDQNEVKSSQSNRFYGFNDDISRCFRVLCFEKSNFYSLTDDDINGCGGFAF